MLLLLLLLLVVLLLLLLLLLLVVALRLLLGVRLVGKRWVVAVKNAVARETARAIVRRRSCLRARGVDGRGGRECRCLHLHAQPLQLTLHPVLASALLRLL